MLTVTHLTTKELKKIKYTEIRQAYNLFVSALKFEDESVRNKEHFALRTEWGFGNRL